MCITFQTINTSSGVIFMALPLFLFFVEKKFRTRVFSPIEKCFSVKIGGKLFRFRKFSGVFSFLRRKGKKRVSVLEAVININQRITKENL